MNAIWFHQKNSCRYNLNSDKEQVSLVGTGRQGQDDTSDPNSDISTAKCDTIYSGHHLKLGGFIQI